MMLIINNQKGAESILRIEEQLEKAAYLHDVGKLLCGRADFFKDYLPGEEGKLISHMLDHSDSPDDLMSAILHEADIIATGVDSRGVSGEQDALANLFNRFGNEKGPQTYYSSAKMTVENCPYPAEKKANPDFKEVLAYIEDKLRERDAVSRPVQDLARILELGLSYVPAGSDKEGLSDISFFDHAKLTAAAAVCLYHYVMENHPEDGFEWLKNSKEHQKENIFLLASGDISGVQQFIYTIPSKGALKSLRGRSFYLDLLLEHVSDEILEASGLFRSNLLYTGGGHFYLLLPNTEKQKAVMEDFSDKINGWFLRRHSSKLYLAFAWTPCAPAEFMGLTEAGAGDPFRRANGQLSKQKLCRYTEGQLEEMFNAQSAVNKTIDGYRECSICHTSSQELEPYNDEDDSMACPSCRRLYLLGQKMLERDAFLISSTDNGSGLPVPGRDGESYLYPVNVSELDTWKNDIQRVYVKNKEYVPNAKAVYLWLADYTARENNGRILEFEDLAMMSGGSRDENGIKRLAVLRADVDNLGAAFLAGFKGNLATLSRTGALSRRLSIFFKHYIQEISEGNLKGCDKAITEPFSLFDHKKAIKRNVHVVYSGGDDLFLVGAWDDIIGLAVDIHRAFHQFTNGKLTFSAGIGFFSDTCPISEMARVTGDLESAAKDNPDGLKDSLALFGAATEVSTAERIYNEPERFHWNQFTDKVCGEKMAFIHKNFVLPQEGNDDSRLPIGKSGLYRILELLSEGCRENINLARFAYVLARLDPGNAASKERTEAYKKIREQFYSWYKNDDDRMELRTAIELVIYSIREKGEK